MCKKVISFISLEIDKNYFNLSIVGVNECGNVCNRRLEMLNRGKATMNYVNNHYGIKFNNNSMEVQLIRNVETK